nr:hypothetical protein [Allomuricauda sp.]
MGITAAPELCFLTRKPTTNIDSSIDLIEYHVEYGSKTFYFKFSWDHKNSEIVNDNIHIIRGLLLNGKIKDGEMLKMSNEYLEKILNTAVYPKSPSDKLNNLLLTIHKKQEYEGAKIDPDIFEKEESIYSLYFKNRHEYFFYLETLKEKGMLDFRATRYLGSDDWHIGSISLMYSGLEEVIELQEEGENSKKCFVAMSFNSTDEIIAIRETIREAVRQSGYETIFIDEIHFDSDVTINDEIISQIKKCKFLISDYTEQKHGVYFEAGYALGKGKPVIYTCSKKDFASTHFDTNHYPHIVYQDLDELQKGLVNKIEVWIN